MYIVHVYVSRSFLILHKSIFDINLLFVVKIKEYCRVNSLHIIDLLATATPKLAKTDGGETRKDGGWECYDGGVGRYLVRYLVSHLVISGSGRWTVVLSDAPWESPTSEAPPSSDRSRRSLVSLGVVYFSPSIVNLS